MKKEAFTRQEFHELIWKTTRTKILEKYVISDSQFRKICDNMNIKYPKGGYWSKLKHNKSVKIEKLSDDFKGEDKIELIIQEEGMKGHDQSPISLLTNEIQNDPKAPLKVPSKLSNPDILTRNTIEEFEYLKNNGRFADFNKLSLPIRYEITDKKRALRLMDTLVKLLRYRGHSLVENINKHIRINIKGIEFYFHLREKTKRIPGKDKWSTSQYDNTGKFVFHIDKFLGNKEYNDGLKPLEQQLANICAFAGYSEAS
jgi:hypothetical protein